MIRALAAIAALIALGVVTDVCLALASGLHAW